MSDPSQPTSRPDEDPQPDRTSYVAPAAEVLTCGLCHRPTGLDYYEIGGRLACEACRNEVARLTTGGSSVARFAGALALGLLGAAVGFGVYWAVWSLGRWQVGLVAILVGLLVGGGVRLGSRARGGLAYQLLAVALTYSAMVCAIVTPFAPALLDQIVQRQSPRPVAVPRSGEAAPAPGPQALVAEGAAAVPPLTAEADGTPRPLPEGEASAAPGLTARDRVYPLSPAEKALRAALLFWFALQLPLLVGVNNVKWLVIIGLGLYAAWALNRRARVRISGPYRVGGTPAAPAQETPGVR